MPEGPPDDEGLFGREARHREDLLTDFEERWFDGSPPDLPAFVRRHLPPWLPRRDPTIAELIRVDQEFRIKYGESVRVEDYLARLGFAPARDALLDLVLGEFTLRSRFQMPPAVAEYAARFPDIADELQRQLGGWKEAASAEVTAAGGGTLLRVVAGPHRGTAFRLESGRPLVVGRADSADVRLDADRHLSRFHLRLELTAGRILFRDLESRNGTTLNDRRVVEGELTSLDVLRCGGTSIALAPASSAEPTLELRSPSDPEIPESEFAGIPARDEVPGYVLREALGRGPRGVTYAATREATDEEVVVKRIDVPGAAGELLGLISETAELKAVADPIFLLPTDVGIASGRPYLVAARHHPIPFAELTAGKPPAERLPGAVRIVDRILVALAPLHRAGYVHGGITASNVLLERAGDGLRVKVTDFGLARRFRRPGDAQAAVLASDDLLAVGRLLHEFVFGGASAEGSPLPEAAAKLLRRAVDPDPGHRFADATDFSASLRPFADR